MRVCKNQHGQILAYDYTDEIMAYLAGDTHAMDFMEPDTNDQES